MQYEVELSSLAETQYDKILSYLFNDLKNPQATNSVLDDYDETIKRLESMADKFAFCKSDKLKALGLRKIGFNNHRYLMIYRVVDDKVIVEGIYHELQDYENAF